MSELGSQERGGLVGLDVGDKTIGVAVTDELGITVQGVGTVWRKGEKHDFPALAKLLEGRTVTRYVVGWPLNMDGTPSDMSARAEKFARRLNGRFNLPVFTHDERLTTFEAKGHRLAQGQRDGYRDRPVDALAAALLLEGWLAENSATS